MYREGSGNNAAAAGIRSQFVESFGSAGLKIAMEESEEAVVDGSGSETPRPTAVEVSGDKTDTKDGKDKTSPKLDVLNIPSSGPSGLSVMMGRNSRPASADSSKNSSPVNGTHLPSSSSNGGSTSGTNSHLSTVAEERRSAGGSPTTSEPSTGEATPAPLKNLTARSSSTKLDDLNDDNEEEEQVKKTKEQVAPVIEICLPSPNISERTPLLSHHSNTPSRLRSSPSHSPVRTPTFLQKTRNQLVDLGRNARKTTWRDVLDYGVLEPLSNIPAVILGLLLNVLDGVSYGMIM